MNGDNININWTLQIILFLFIFVGGLILGNLITGLTVNRIEQLFEKAEMYFNVKASILKLILNIVQLEKYFILHGVGIPFINQGVIWHQKPSVNINMFLEQFQRVKQINLLEGLLVDWTSSNILYKKFSSILSLQRVQLLDRLRSKFNHSKRGVQQLKSHLIGLQPSNKACGHRNWWMVCFYPNSDKDMVKDW